jgi:alkanesulfonate monooxygenase SsuD/methylene tetrahydromethanopterin reductase-like flavin-dependent oxidoreductase (luciferase family)
VAWWLARSSLERCGRHANGWLGAACTAEQARAARATIEQAAADAGRRIDPEHFGISIGYTHTELDAEQLAALQARSRGADPRALVPVGHQGVREAIESYVAVCMSKFVVRPMFTPAAWSDELAGLAAAVADLQT